LLKAGAVAARSAMESPQEGTALTVLDAAANASAREPGAAAVAARHALRRTPEMLEALQLAGVVDAGGRGVVLLLDALNSVWHDTDLTSPAEGFVPLSVPQLQSCTADAAYELMFITNADVAHDVSAKISEYGVSLAVTTGVDLSQIHIHCDDPEYVIRVAENFAPVRNIRIEKLANNTVVRRRLIAQAFGSGIVQLLAEANVVVVAAEPDSRPSVQDFVSAAIKANASQVILLPSDKDSLKVAQLAAAEIEAEDIECHVVPTISIQQTLAAVSVSDPQADMRDEIEVLSSAARAVTSIGLTRASRTTGSLKGEIAEGDVLSFLNGELHASNKTFKEALSQLIATVESAELVTVIPGRDLTEDQQTTLTHLLQQKFPNAEIATIAGRQDVWTLLVGLE
jgi:dihydroxyacetone kinase-like predicted kinase